MKTSSLEVANNGQKIHIGHLISIKLKDSGKNIKWLAGQINCSRENVYKVFEKEWINTEMLFRICTALNYNFFDDFSSCCDKILSERGLKND